MIRPIATATPPNACEGSRPIYTELGAKLARDAGFHVVMTPAELAALARCTPINTKGSKA